MEDGKIIDLYWARSERAIEETDQKYGAYCTAIARNILHDEEDARECVNDTYLRAWNAMPPQRPDRLAVFLGKITRNLSLNRFRLTRTEKRGAGQTALALSELEECVSGRDDPALAAEAGVVTACIEGFLCRQSKTRRDIFLQRYWYLSPVKEIARDHAVSESKVTALLFRMRKELKQYLEQEGIEV